MTVYQVRARRSGDWLALEVPELPGVFSQAKWLDKAGAASREAIAVMLDIDAEDVLLSVQPVLPDEVTAVVQAAQETRRAAERAQTINKEATRVLTRDLGLSLRDAGAILDLVPAGRPASRACSARQDGTPRQRKTGDNADA